MPNFILIDEAYTFVSHSDPKVAKDTLEAEANRVLSYFASNELTANSEKTV